MLKQLSAALEELFEWLGDMSLSERSHIMIPVKVEKNMENEPLHRSRNTYFQDK